MKRMTVDRAAGVTLVVVVLVGMMGAVAAQRRGGDPKLRTLKNPVPATPAAVTAGRQLYAKNCRHCHGLRGRGDGSLAPKDPRPADLTDATWDHGSTDGEIFTLILNGAPATDTEMKGMKGTLTPTQIWQIVHFIRTLGPKPGAK